MAKSFIRKSRGTQAREAKRGLWILKRAGIYKGSVPKGKLRGWQPSDYAERQLKQFSDIVSGSAASVRITKSKRGSAAKVAKEYKKAGLRVKEGRVIVPAAPGDKFSFNKKSGVIEGTGQGPRGETVKKYILTDDRNKLFPKRPWPKGKRYRVAVPFKRGKGAGGGIRYQRWTDEKELRSDMKIYYSRYQEWEAYAVLEEY